MDPSTYELLLFGHLLFVAIWVGGDALIQAFAFRSLRAGPQRTVDLLGPRSPAAFLGPESGRVGKLAAERGAEDPEVQRRIRRVLMVSRVELVLLIALIFDMVVKPGA